METIWLEGRTSEKCSPQTAKGKGCAPYILLISVLVLLNGDIIMSNSTIQTTFSSIYRKHTGPRPDGVVARRSIDDLMDTPIQSAWSVSLCLSIATNPLQ